MKATFKSPSYLVRNPYSYRFRMIVPKDLRQFVGKTELRYTLRTGNLRIAKNKARLLAGQVQLIFIHLRKGSSALSKLSEDRIKELVHHYIKGEIEKWDRGFNEERDWIHVAGAPPFVDAGTFKTYIEEMDGIRSNFIASLNVGDFRPVERPTDNLLKKNGFNKIDKSSQEYQKLCAEILTLWI